MQYFKVKSLLQYIQTMWFIMQQRLSDREKEIKMRYEESLKGKVSLPQFITITCTFSPVSLLLIFLKSNHSCLKDLEVSTGVNVLNIRKNNYGNKNPSDSYSMVRIIYRKFQNTIFCICDYYNWLYPPQNRFNSIYHLWYR